MVVFFNEVVVFFGGDYVFFLDVMIIWTFRNVIIYVFIYFGGYIGYRFFSVFIILQKKGNLVFNKNEIQ